MSLMHTIRHYTCKYLDPNKRVYAISSNGAKTVVGTHNFLTVPFIHKDRADTSNVVASFLHPEHAQSQIKYLHEQIGVTCDIVSYSLSDLSYYAKAMNIPVIVISDAWCHLNEKEEWYDLYYTSRNLETSGTECEFDSS